ncbi:DUF302 domain-containing protein [Candidatus Albibeggiatoa sp. nov. NOAA]|uniref:DUF302 domain-containing protein n=1 Tax=Candidatus Albibeggiatoa sp. nov. NOAA TaxID=3162724 RepID=UPI0032FB590F|nr:DUF302 domain-containing protein [Thiotrichaceae bacterium]
MAFSFNVSLEMDFDAAVEKVTETLKAHKFGVLTEINVDIVLKAKMDVDMPRYLILGACNPPIANQMIQADPDIGSVMPCNVLVRDAGNGQVVVAFLDPETVFGLSEQEAIKPILADAKQKLLAVYEDLKTK